ncbi:hypothetical protein Trydic_g16405 [Trypoxylus dichotomus]
MKVTSMTYVYTIQNIILYPISSGLGPKGHQSRKLAEIGRFERAIIRIPEETRPPLFGSSESGPKEYQSRKPAEKRARQCNEGLIEACGDTALSYWTAARWVKAFNERRGGVIDLARSDCPSVNVEQVKAVATLLDTDRRQTIRELGHEIGLSHTTVHILKNRMGNCIAMDSPQFDGNIAIDTIQCCKNLLNSKDEGTTS